MGFYVASRFIIWFGQFPIIGRCLLLLLCILYQAIMCLDDTTFTFNLSTYTYRILTSIQREKIIEYKFMTIHEPAIVSYSL
jgi:hypothetical protein